MSPGDFDAMLDALSNVHRRRLLLELAESNPHGELPNASVPAHSQGVIDDPDQVATGEPDQVATGEPDQMEVEALQARMFHEHLPNLARHEFVDWNRKTGTVMKGPAFEEVRPLIELLDDHEDELPDDWL